MPADEVEIVDAEQEGVKIEYLVAPTKAVIEEATLRGLTCIRMELGEPDKSGRRRPVPVKGSEFLFSCDWVISAIGQEPDLAGLENTTFGPIATTKWSTIQADPETFATSVPGIFAGGDAMTGPAAAIDAIGGGRKAAWVIDRYLATGTVEKFQAGFASQRTKLAPLDPVFLASIEKTTRQEMPKLDGEARIRHWEEVDLGVDAAQVRQETSRCLSCGCTSVFDCDLKVFSGNYDANQERYKGQLKRHKLDDRHPYILLDSNKCILCGRCVRYCGDLIDVHALGFINRGYETVVKPALDKPLAETACIACGNCIEVCPTGAITFKATLDKPGPFRTVPARTVCAFCGVGCEMDVNHVGRDFFFVTAKPTDPYTEGELCAKGRFGTAYLGDRERLYACRVKGMERAEMPEAARALVDGLARVRAAHGAESILFLASPRVSTESAWLFASLARRIGTRFVFPAEDLLRAGLPDASGLSGFNISTAAQGDLADADVVVTVGERVAAYNPVFEFAIRRATKRGAAWVHVGPVPAAWRRDVTHAVDCLAGEEAAALSALCGAIAAEGLVDRGRLAEIENVDSFLARPFARPMPGVEEAARLIAEAGKKVVLAINQDAAVGSDGSEVAWAADLALLTGRTGGGRGGLLVVKNDANGQGVQDVIYGAGFAGGADLAAAQARLRAGGIKAVVFLGVDPAGLGDLDAYLARAEFTAAIDLFPTAATARADVVVPLCPLQEEAGSVVSFDGRVVKFERVFKPLAGFTTPEFLGEAEALAGGARLGPAAIRVAIAAALPLYRSLAKEGTTALLRDEAALASGRPRFRGLLLPTQGQGAAYGSATTVSRRYDARIRVGTPK
jgi:formate dehydrogenase major subunit